LSTQKVLKIEYVSPDLIHTQENLQNVIKAQYIKQRVIQSDNQHGVATLQTWSVGGGVVLKNRSWFRKRDGEALKIGGEKMKNLCLEIQRRLRLMCMGISHVPCLSLYVER
jgi:hypothetical protein